MASIRNIERIATLQSILQIIPIHVDNFLDDLAISPSHIY